MKYEGWRMENVFDKLTTGAECRMMEESFVEQVLTWYE
jgi:hypothetical protein